MVAATRIFIETGLDERSRTAMRSVVAADSGGHPRGLLSTRSMNCYVCFSTLGPSRSDASRGYPEDFKFSSGIPLSRPVTHICL